MFAGILRLSRARYYRPHRITLPASSQAHQSAPLAGAPWTDADTASRVHPAKSPDAVWPQRRLPVDTRQDSHGAASANTDYRDRDTRHSLISSAPGIHALGATSRSPDAETASEGSRERHS